MINFALLDDAFPNEDKSAKKLKKSNKQGNINDCKSIQAPAYLVPQTCDNSQSKAMNIALGDGKFKDDFKKDAIKPFDFDEMDAYLNVNNIKTNYQDSSNEYRTTPFLGDYLKTLKKEIKTDNSKTTDKTLNIEQFTNINGGNLKVDVNLYNLFLFIFLGIVIILLIDQITKLAIELKLRN